MKIVYFFLIYCIFSFNLAKTTHVSSINETNDSTAAKDKLEVAGVDRTTENKINLEAILTKTQNVEPVLARLREIEANFAEKEIKYEKLEEDFAIQRAKSKRHDKEIQESRNEIIELKNQNQIQSERISQLESQLFGANQNPSKIDENKMINPYVEIKIPKSCQELFELGQKINGIYMLHNSDERKILSVFCNFQVPKYSPAMETVFGYVDVKSSPVHFSVGRSGYFDKVNQIIPYKIENFNDGNAMDLKAGIFTVPKTGIYQFAFSSVKGANVILGNELRVSLRVNGVSVGVAYGALSKTWEGAHFGFTKRLGKGDRVDTFLLTGNLYDIIYFNTQFTGSLLEEEITALNM